MEISKPNHNKFIFKNLDEDTYVEYAKRYSLCKRTGYRGIVCFVSGLGMKDLAIEIVKGTYC